MTYELDDVYSVDVQHAERIAPKIYTAKGAIFEHASNGPSIQEVTGRGTTPNKAENAARLAAVRALPEIRRAL